MSIAVAMPAPPESLAGTEVIAYVLADLAIILLAARIVGGIVARLGQPRIVGEMIAGILIGPTILGGQLAKPGITALGISPVDGSGLTNSLYPLQAFSFLSLIGALTLIFFMFMIGLEVNQKIIRGREKQILIVAAGVIIVPVALGFLVGGILDDPGKWKSAMTVTGADVSSTTHALFLGAALAVTAFPVMARILQEKRMLNSPMGGIGVGAAAVVTPLMFLILAGAVASAKGQGVPGTIGIKLLLAIALLLFLFLAVRPVLKVILDRRFNADEPLDGDLFALLLFGAIACGLAADRIGINSLNGGFLFGACVPQITGLGRAVLARLQQFVVVFLIPIFLTVSGLQTNLRILDTSLIGGIVLFVAAMIAAKWLAGALAGRLVGLTWRESNTIGVLMNCRGLMILVVAVIGKQAGVITDPMYVTLVIGAIVTTLMTGPLVDVFLPSEEVEAEREKSISGSIEGLPTMTGGPRVLLAPDTQAAAALAVKAAAGYLAQGGDRPQFLLAYLPPLAPAGEYVGAGREEEAHEVGRAFGWLRPIGDALKAQGADVDVVSFQSPDPAEDLAKLAQEWAASDALVSSASAAGALKSAGKQAQLLR